MGLLGNAFLYIRNEYINRLINYRIPHKRLDTLSFKYIIANCPIRIKLVANHHYEITFHKDTFYQSVLNEIQQFYIRSAQQDLNIKYAKNKYTKSWLMVTDYYKLFFAINCLLRIMHSGIIFIDSSLSKELSSLFSALTMSTICLHPGTYILYRSNHLSYSNSVEVILKKSNKQAHETLWIEFFKKLEEVLSKASGDEKTILQQIKDIFSRNGLTHPSRLRNKINYNGEIAYKEIENDFFYNIYSNETKFMKYLISTSINMDINNQLKFINLICYYFFFLNENLIDELIDRISGSLYYIKTFRKLTNRST